MTFEEILVALKQFNEDWLKEKRKFFQLETGYDKNTDRIEVKRWLYTDILDDDFGNYIVDEHGLPIKEDVFDHFYINFPEYCWNSDFDGALSRDNETIDEDDAIVPIYSLPQDLKTIGHLIIDYLVQGIEMSRHEQVGVALDKLKRIIIDPDDEPEMRRVKKSFFNEIYGQLKKRYSFFFDELTEIKAKNSLGRQLSPGICAEICRFKIDNDPFITGLTGDKTIPKGTLLYKILTTSFEEHEHLNATLKSQAWPAQDVFYLILRVKKIFPDVVSIAALSRNKKLLLSTGMPLNRKTFDTFNSKKVEGYKKRHAARVTQIDGQLTQFL